MTPTAALQPLGININLTILQMIIECDFTNASDFVRERVVFMTEMKLMADSENRLFSVGWDEPQTIASLFKLKRAMHDSEFRIHLDREGLLVTMVRCLGIRWSFFFISIDWRQGKHIYSKICVIQRNFRRRFMHRRLSIDMVFSKAATAQKVLKDRLHHDVLWMIVLHCCRRTKPCLQQPPDGPLRWVKPQGHGQILA